MLNHVVFPVREIGEFHFVKSGAWKSKQPETEGNKRKVVAESYGCGRLHWSTGRDRLITLCAATWKAQCYIYSRVTIVLIVSAGALIKRKSKVPNQKTVPTHANILLKVFQQGYT